MRNWRTLFYGIDVIVLLLSIGWFFAQPGFESAISLLVASVTLVTLLGQNEANDFNQLKTWLGDFFESLTAGLKRGLTWIGNLHRGILFFAGILFGTFFLLLFMRAIATSPSLQTNGADLIETQTVVTPETDYLKELFIMWTIAGELDQWVLSAFNSILVLEGNDRPVDTLKAWIEDAKIRASNATEIPASMFDYLEVDLSIDSDSLSLEDSFYRLWKRAIEERGASNMAKVRLALIARVGEKRQQDLIGKWNEQLK